MTFVASFLHTGGKPTAGFASKRTPTRPATLLSQFRIP